MVARPKILELLKTTKLTYAEIGERAGVSRQRVGQIARQSGHTRPRTGGYEFEHGTMYTYRHIGCRCTKCVAAFRGFKRESVK